MPMKHQPLGLEECHFQVWLELWARQCHAQLAPKETALVAVAEAIGPRLRAMTGVSLIS